MINICKLIVFPYISNEHGNTKFIRAVSFIMSPKIKYLGVNLKQTNKQKYKTYLMKTSNADERPNKI